jgi:hypothetical protein
MARETNEVTRKLKLDKNEISENRFALIPFALRRITDITSIVKSTERDNDITSKMGSMTLSSSNRRRD